jgi:hypothetical protein
MHALTTRTPVHFKPADGSGNIDGWEAVCEDCGFRTGSSLGERWAARQGREHVEFMARKDTERPVPAAETAYRTRDGLTHTVPAGGHFCTQCGETAEWIMEHLHPAG